MNTDPPVRDPATTDAEPAASTTILVGIANPGMVRPLMDVIARVARPGETHVLATHVVVIPGQMSLSSARSAPEVGVASRLLTEAIDAGGAEGLAVDGVVEISREVHEGLASAAESRDVDLVVIGWSDRSHAAADESDESSFDDLMDRVAAEVDRDLLVVKLRGDSMQRVLVPIAESPHLPLLASIVRGLSASGSDVTFLHVVDEDADSTGAAGDISELLARHGLDGLGAVDVVAAKSAAAAVLGCAEHYDAAVIGAAVKTALAEAVFGSAAETIADEAPCSVLVARAGER